MNDWNPERRSPAKFPMLGLDISETKIGLAIAEGMDSSPKPLFTYRRMTRSRDLEKCAEWVRQFNVGSIVVGLPLNMDGTLGPRAQWMRRFCRELQERLKAPLMLQDERLTTVEAEEILLEQGYSHEERCERIDSVAAALIIERFLHESR